MGKWLELVIYISILVLSISFAFFMSWLFRKVIPWSRDKE